MSRFRVTFAQSGASDTIIVDANDKYEALKIAKTTVNGTIISVDMAGFDMKLFLTNFSSRQNIAPKELIMAAIQISTMTGAGIPLLTALENIVASGSGEVASVFGSVIREINAGLGFGAAIERNSQMLGREFVSMAKLGEQTGDMASAMNGLAQMLNKKSKIIEKLQKATAYPLLTLASIIVAFIVIMVVVAPKFEAIFDKFHLKLPFFTMLLLGTERFLVDFGVLLFCLLLSTFLLCLTLYRRHAEFRYKTDRILLSLPFFGKLLHFGCKTVKNI